MHTRQVTRAAALLALTGIMLVTGRPAFAAVQQAPAAAPIELAIFTVTGDGPDDAPEPVLVELRLGRIAARTVPAYRVGDAALLPLTQFFEMAEINAVLESTGRLTGMMQPGSIPFSIDAREAAAVYGGRRISLSPAVILFADGEIFLAAEELGKLFELDIAVDWSALEVVIRDPESLPIADRLRRQSAREALRLGRHRQLADLTIEQERRPWGGFVLDYSWFAPSSDPVGGGAYSLAAGADAFGGSLEAGVRSVGRADDGAVDVEGSWLGVWRESRWVKQLRLGDGIGGGPRPRAQRGLLLTNSPYVRPSLIGTAAYDGRLPAGWQVEAYRSGELIALDSAGPDGVFSMNLPALYGENPVEFVAYGPFGERRQFGSTYRVSTELIPAGTFEYALSGGACRFQPCSATGNLDLRYGLSSRWTGAAGIDRIWRDTIPGGTFPYAGVTGHLTNAVGIEADIAANAYLHGRLAYVPTLDLQVAADYTRFDDDPGSTLFNPLARRSQLQVSAFFRPSARRDFLYIEAAAEVATTATSRIGRARGGASVQLRGLRILPYARVERETFTAGGGTTRSFVGASAFMLPGAALGGAFRQMWLRAAYESQGLSQPSLVSLSVARPLAASTRVEAGIGWMRGQRGPAFTFSLSSALSAVRAFTTVTAPTDGPASASQLVQGSVLYDRPAGRMRLAAGPSLQRGGVAGRVFLDLNGNGRFDLDEEGLPNVRVQVGAGSATSDEDGVYRVGDILPFEPVLVVVDSLSFESPLWVAPYRTIAVTPAPNRSTRVDIPLVMGAVVEGTVARIFGGAPQGVAGVPLILTDRRTGERRSMTTFSDGVFYTLGITPGDYELTVEAAVRDMLGVTAAPVRFTVSPRGDPPGAIQVMLEPRP